MGQLVYVNGNLVQRDQAVVSAFDRSFLYGDGLFETIRAYGGVPFLLEEHLDRLGRSATELGIAVPDRDEIAGAVHKLITANKLGDVYVRITLSRGIHDGALAPDKPMPPTLVIDARLLHPYPDELYRRGARVTVSSYRHDSGSPLRRHKTTSYLLSVLARQEAARQGADEAVLLDHAGHVAEGSVSSVFIVRGGVLWTPPLDMNILPGVTRAAVLRLAREAGIEICEARFDLAAFQAADEAFLTNALMEILPVCSVAGRDLPETAGRPGMAGPITASLSQAYAALVRMTAGKRP